MQISLDLYSVDLERFQGPLDLLLHLIRKQDIDIFDIPIARITAQFLAAIESVDRLELERAGDFLEMAATLVRVKAQMLFPRRPGEEEDDPRADLVRRLLEYEHFRDSARALERLERERARLHAKGYVEVRAPQARVETPLDTTWNELWAAVRALGSRLEEPEGGFTVSTRLVQIEEMIEAVMEAVRLRPRVEFSVMVRPWGTRMHAVVSLLACLELAKQSTLRLRQRHPFEPLWVYRRGLEEAA
jgi:segregation and condensation protein A